MPFGVQLKLHSYRFRLATVLLILLVSGILISARRKSSEASMADEPNQEPRAVKQVESELVTITPGGFEPIQITRSQGPFILAIDNRSGLEDVQLYFERETGVRLSVALGRNRKLAWRETVDFPPGQYILRAANDDSWRCLITVMP